MTDRYLVAQVLASAVETDDHLDALEASIKLIAHSDRTFARDTVADLLSPDFDRTASEGIHDILVHQNIVDDDYLDESTLRTVVEGAKVILERGDVPENELVATIPREETAIDESAFGNLLYQLRDLIASAEREIIIMNPFFSEQIVDRISSPLQSAAERGVSITIITRSLTYDDHNEYNREAIKNLFQNAEIADQTRLYEYVEDTEDLGGTFHAKMVLADNTRCYLGTANLTHRGLRDNLELGLIFYDDNIEKLRKLIRSLTRSDLLHSVRFTGTDFERH